MDRHEAQQQTDTEAPDLTIEIHLVPRRHDDPFNQAVKQLRDAFYDVWLAIVRVLHMEQILDWLAARLRK